MMKKLDEMTRNPDVIAAAQELSDGLKFNAVQHRNYQVYTTMERALGIILSGYYYLVDGSRWNDPDDYKQVVDKKVYAASFGWRTSESIAPWMLYSDKGKDGAMLSFTPSIMESLLDAEEVELGSFDKHNKFHCDYKLKKSSGDYEIYLTDIIYTDYCNKGMVRLTYGDEHVTVDQRKLNGKCVFHKDFAWSYEKECRLCVEPTAQWYDLAKKAGCCAVRIKMPADARRKLEERLWRSPVYKGGVDCGTPSKLTDKVNW